MNMHCFGEMMCHRELIVPVGVHFRQAELQGHGTDPKPFGRQTLQTARWNQVLQRDFQLSSEVTGLIKRETARWRM